MYEVEASFWVHRQSGLRSDRIRFRAARGPSPFPSSLAAVQPAKTRRSPAVAMPHRSFGPNRLSSPNIATVDATLGSC